MISNPYETTYGRVINISKITKSVEEYLIKTELRNLNYEYPLNDEVGLVFITGCNEDEREIPPFTHPLVIKSRNKLYTVVDARPYIGKLHQQPLNLADVARDTGNLNFVAYRGVVEADFLAGNYGIYKKYLKSVSGAYALLIGYLIDSIVKLNPAERSMVEIAASYFSILQFTPNSEFVNPNDFQYIHNSAIANINRLALTYKVNGKFIEEVVNKFSDVQFTGTIDNLLEYVSRALSNGKEQIISKNVFINIVSGLWYGHGAAETVIISLENLPTWIALLYTALSNPMFKKSRLASILLKYSRNIDANNFVSSFEADMKNR